MLRSTIFVAVLALGLAAQACVSDEPGIASDAGGDATAIGDSGILGDATASGGDGGGCAPCKLGSSKLGACCTQ